MSMVRLVLAFVLLLGFAGPAAAHGWGSIEESLDDGRFAGPDGWRRMCQTLPRYCAPTGPGRVRLDAAGRALLAEVNAEVNAAIRPRDEPFGEDVWRVAPAFGDCDDYALTKRAVLEGRGWPAASLRFATAFTEADEYHLVLLIETDQGTLVLDNRFDRPVPWTRLSAGGYKWVAIEAGDRRDWRLAAGALDLVRRRTAITAAP